MRQSDNTFKETLLVVDDTPENLGVLFDYLDLMGFTVLLVQNGENALKQAEENLPDLVLLDIMMPVLDGFEICQRLKANDKTKDIPVIFMTALTDTTDKVRGFQVGGVDYITKPFQHEEVVARIQTHLTLRKLQQELQKKNTILEQYVEMLAEKTVQLDEKNSQLQEANASKDRFFSIISHDLRAPFVGLLGLTQLITDEFDTYEREQLKSIMLKLRKSSESMYALLENLLTWSRIQRGLIEHQPLPLDLQDLVKKNFYLLHSNAGQKQITLSHTIPDQIRVYADEKMVDTVLRNLLSNALKFTYCGGNVHVSVMEESDDMLSIAVTDTGIGMNEENLAKLFRIDAKFTRTGTADEHGTGLGLILCKEFVERNGGRIEVESEVEKGTTFRFTLPRKSPEEVPKVKSGKCKS